LFQGIGEGDNKGQRIKGTNTCLFIKHDKVPNKKVEDITYAKLCAPYKR